jgi:acyl-CoA thioester hydrolase
MSPLPLPRHVPLEAAGYRSFIQLPILWGDQDAFRHVNNTLPIRWFECARIAYLEHSGVDEQLEHLQLGPILASITCNYRQQLVYPDQVWVGARVSRLGGSSFTMEHALYSDSWKETLVAEGSSVLVVFDYHANRPRRMPDEIRQRIEAFEAASPEN